MTTEIDSQPPQTQSHEDEEHPEETQHYEEDPEQDNPHHQQHPDEFTTPYRSTGYRLHVNTSPTSSQKKMYRRSLFEPTVSMIAARRELDKRRVEISPKDDPFWEKRGSKGDYLLPKAHEVVEYKPPKPLSEVIETTPILPSTSHLLTPTKALKYSQYNQDSNKKKSENHIKPLPSDSHLLTLTKATVLGEYKPPDTRPVSPSKNISKIFSEGMVHAMQPTTAHIRGMYSRNKDHVEGPIPLADREEIKLPKYVKSSEKEQFKHVQSKLLEPTTAYLNGKWSPNKSPSFDSSHSHSHDETNEEGAAAFNGSGERRKSYLGYYGQYAHIPSKLHEPTISNLASMWQRPPEFDELYQVDNEPDLPTKHSPLAPAAESRLFEATHAYEVAQREKFEKHNDGDIGTVEYANHRRKSINTIHKPGEIKYYEVRPKSGPSTRSISPVDPHTQQQLSSSAASGLFESIHEDEETPGKSLGGLAAAALTALALDEHVHEEEDEVEEETVPMSPAAGEASEVIETPAAAPVGQTPMEETASGAKAIENAAEPVSENDVGVEFDDAGNDKELEKDTIVKKIEDDLLNEEEENDLTEA